MEKELKWVKVQVELVPQGEVQEALVPQADGFPTDVAWAASEAIAAYLGGLMPSHVIVNGKTYAVGLDDVLELPVWVEECEGDQS